MTVVTYKNVKRPIIHPGDLPMLALFARGEQGAWYDPSDLYNYAMELGDDLIDVGFVEDAGWQLGEGWSLQDGSAYRDTSSSWSNLAKTLPSIEAGKYYEVSIEVQALNVSPTNGISITLGSGSTSDRIATQGKHTFRMVAGANNKTLYIQAVSGGTSVVVRSISVRKLMGISRATMFQDAEGTIPVTSVEQPVGLILDKSGNGNHASQLTAPARPMLSARVNLITRSEGPLASLAVNGTPTGVVDASETIEGFSSSYYFGDNSVQRSLYLSRYMTDDGATTFSVFIQMDDDGIPEFGTDFRFYVKGSPVNSGAVVTHVRDSLYRVSYTTTGSGSFTGVQKLTTNSNRGFRVAGYQVEFGTTMTKYQRVTSATEYDWQGWPLYLRFDGVDDVMASAATVPVRSADGAYASVVRSRSPASGTGYQPTFAIAGSGTRYFRVDSLRSMTSGQAGASVRDDVNYSPAGGYRASLGSNSDPVNETHFHEGWLESGGALNARRSDITSRVSPTGAGVIDFSGSVTMGNTAVGENIYGGIYVSRSTTSTERTAVRKFLSDKTKVPA